MKRKLLSAKPTPPADRPAATEGIANVRDYGAKGNGRTDDTAAFQAAIDSLDKPKNKSGWSKAGGVIGVSNGWYSVKGPLDIRHGNIRIEGTGSTCLTDRSCWIHFTGTKGPLFRFPHNARSPEGFSIKNILLVGQGRASTTAIELWTGPSGVSNFRHGLVFSDMGIYHFGTAFAINRKSRGGYQAGYLRVHRCYWSLCGQAFACRGATSINGLSITDCVMRQCRPTPVKPALDLKVFGGRLCGNSFEGNPHALLIRDSTAVAIRDNFFEDNKLAVRVIGSTDVVVENSRCYGDYAGKFELAHSTGLTINEPSERIVLDKCRDVRGVAGPWRGIVSTEKKP